MVLVCWNTVNTQMLATLVAIVLTILLIVLFTQTVIFNECRCRHINITMGSEFFETVYTTETFITKMLAAIDTFVGCCCATFKARDGWLVVFFRLVVGTRDFCSRKWLTQDIDESDGINIFLDI